MMTVPAYRKWVVVGLIWIVACLNYMDRMTLFAIFPILHKQMGLSNVALAMLGSVFLWAYGLCSPIGGYLGDRFNRKTVIAQIPSDGRTEPIRPKEYGPKHS